MKKKLLAIFIVMLSVFSLPQNNAYAASCTGEETFFGLPAWYRGLVEPSGNGCKIKDINPNGGLKVEEFVWTVVANLIDAAFRIVGLAAIGYIIYSGFQYMLATGDPGKIASAKKSLTNAIIGLVIAVLASIIVNLILGIFG